MDGGLPSPAAAELPSLLSHKRQALLEAPPEGLYSLSVVLSDGLRFCTSSCVVARTVSSIPNGEYRVFFLKQGFQGFKIIFVLPKDQPPVAFSSFL